MKGTVWTDELATAQLSAAAAWVVVTYSLAFGATKRESIGIAIGMTIWFNAVIYIGASELLRDAIGLEGIPKLGYVVALPLAVNTSTLLLTSSGRKRVLAASFPTIISVQILRVLGFWFIILYNTQRLPAPFAPVAGWGDILAGVLAAPAAWIAAHDTTSRRGISLILMWNVIGAVDLLTAVSLGITSFPGPLRIWGSYALDSSPMTDLPWLIIPGFLVPSLLTLHAATFYRLYAGPPASRKANKEF